MLASTPTDKQPLYTLDLNLQRSSVTAPTVFKPLTKNDIADVLGVSLRTVENWVNDGTVPAPKKIGNRVYWHPNVFYAWLEQRLMNGVADEAATEGAVLLHQADEIKSKSQKPRAKAAGTELDLLLAREESKLQAMLG